MPNTMSLSLQRLCEDFCIPIELIEKHYYKKEEIAGSLLNRLKTLAEAGITFSECPELYQAVIADRYNADKLSAGFVTLAAAGITFSECPKAYQAVIADRYNADKLSAGFVTLAAAGITFSEQPKAYQAVIADPYSADKLSAGFVTLAAAGITFSECSELYQAVIANPYSADKLSAGFAALAAAGITFSEHPKAYLAVIAAPAYADKLSAGFVTLAAAGITFSEHPKAYLAVIANRYNADKLSAGFAALAAAGITFLKNPEAYLAVIAAPAYADKLSAGFVTLAAAGIAFSECPKAYQAVIAAPAYADKLSAGFAALAAAGITFLKNPEAYQAVIAAPAYADKLSAGFAALAAAGITFLKNPEAYLAVIAAPAYADKLSAGFAALAAAGITFLKNPEAYQAVIAAPAYADKLSAGFVTLAAAGITFLKNPEAYQAVIAAPHVADNLSVGFAALANAGITFLKNPEAYLAVIAAPYFADYLSAGFAALAAAGITFLKNPEAYLAVIAAPAYADKLSAGFAALAAAGITFSECSELYQAVIAAPAYADKLSVGFAALANAGITFPDHSEFYLALIKTDGYASQWPQVITEFHKANIQFEANEELYKAAIKNKVDPNNLGQIFSLMPKLAINIEKGSRFLNKNFLTKHDKITIYVLSEMESSGITYASNPVFLDALLEMLSQNEAPYQTIINIVKRTSDYAKANSGEVAEAVLASILHEETSQCEYLTDGPLEKLHSTLKIEEILEAICDEDIDLRNCFRFEAPNDYFLTLPNKPEVNLSLLMRSANLSHLTLSDDLIKKIEAKLKSIMSLPEYTDNNPFVKLLAPMQQTAMKLYLGNMLYENTNRLFRTEPFNPNPHLNYFPEQPSKNIFAFFVIGCLLNDAVNKLGWLTDTVDEMKLLNKLIYELEQAGEKIIISDYINDDAKFSAFLKRCVYANVINQSDCDTLMSKRDVLAFFFPDESAKLIRDELLEPAEIKKRLANPWRFPSLTSFSAFKEGSYAFQSGIKTTLEGGPKPWIVNRSEGEVLFSHGGQVITTQGPHGMISRFVRTPSLVGRDHYWSDTALQYAFKNYLNKPYTLHDCSQEINGIAVARPNHGLPHTYRVMLYLENIIHYFAQYAQDPEFKYFCQSLSDADFEWLRVAAAFSITGRESEMSAIDNLALYDTFRQASSEHFTAYVNETIVDAPEDSEEQKRHHIERMQNIVRYMGNPHYDEINNHPNDKERKLRNFYHRILTMAHKMDLVRCYSVEQCKTSMLNPIKSYSAESDAQNRSLEEMVRYAIALNKKHGNALSCDMLPSGELTDVNLSYEPIFAEVSQSWKRLFDVTQMVTVPKIKPPKEENEEGDIQVLIENKGECEHLPMFEKHKDQGAIAEKVGKNQEMMMSM